MENEALTGLTLDRPSPSTMQLSGSLRVETFATRAMMGAAAASDIAATIAAMVQDQPQVRMVFAAAPSQSDVLDMLCQARVVDWRRVVAFHMDEYIGLPVHSPARFANWLDAHLFSKLPFAAVHKMSPESGAQAEAQRYAGLLSESPIDIVCLGIGVNGHIAFNDPAVADFDDPDDVKVVALDQICRQQQVDDACFARLADVPQEAITLTIPRLLRAKRLFCVVPGLGKKNAVRETLYGKIDKARPASILRTHPVCTLYLDKDSNPDA